MTELWTVKNQNCSRSKFRNARRRMFRRQPKMSFGIFALLSIVMFALYKELSQTPWMAVAPENHAGFSNVSSSTLTTTKPTWVYARYIDFNNLSDENGSSASIPMEQDDHFALSTSPIDLQGEKNTRNKPIKAVIVQYAGAGNDYMTMLNLSLVCTHAYARRWRSDWDVFELRGILPLFGSLNSRKKTTDPALATYNKVAILSKLAHEMYYDYVLLLDADAVFVDQSFNLLQWVQQIEGQDAAATMGMNTTTSRLVYAHRVMAQDSANTWNVNIGVTLWNLRHPKLRLILRKWKFRCRRRQFWKLPHDDQRPLQAILKQQQDKNGLVLVYADKTGIFNGRVIKHFIRVNSHEWGDPSSSRLVQIEQTVKEVCSS